MTQEVRFEYLKGRDAVRRRRGKPLALCPERVAMSRIKPRHHTDHRWGEANGPRQASAAFGRQAVRRIVAHLRDETRALLNREDGGAGVLFAL